jgi:acyl carrier protein
MGSGKDASMDVNTAIDINAVRAVVVETLGVEDRSDALDATSPLLGSVPELDSMAVLELVFALEQRFGITIEGQDVTADVFETVASLAAFVDSKLD